MMDLTQAVLDELSKNDELNTLEFAKSLKADHQAVVGAMKSLDAIGGVWKNRFLSIMIICRW